MKIAWAYLALMVGGIGLVACGGAPSASKAAPSAPSTPSYEMGPQQQAGYPSQAPPPMMTPRAESKKSDASGQGMPAAGASAPTTAGANARANVEAAQRELDRAGSDCTAACRALGSMERATARLCTIEESSCEDVRVRLRKARERIRSTCGGCPNGPSVDPDAPIPSTQ